MRDQFRWIVFTAAATALLATPTVADDVAPVPTGREIMELVDARDDGDFATQDMAMVLIDKNGNKRLRSIRSLRRDEGELCMRVRSESSTQVRFAWLANIAYARIECD